MVDLDELGRLCDAVERQGRHSKGLTLMAVQLNLGQARELIAMARDAQDARGSAYETAKQAARFHELLRRVEWPGVVLPGGIERFCPQCGHERRDGHAPDCELAAALAGGGE